MDTVSSDILKADPDFLGRFVQVFVVDLVHSFTVPVDSGASRQTEANIVRSLVDICVDGMGAVVIKAVIPTRKSRAVNKP